MISWATVALQHPGEIHGKQNKRPPEEHTAIAPQKLKANIRNMGVNLVENDEAEEELPPREKSEEVAEGQELVEGKELVEVQQGSVSTKSKAKEPLERAADPTRMYLRDMSSVEFLSREGEIAIAKRMALDRCLASDKHSNGI
jgi:RNA polymerase primary sigma factor